MIFTQMSIFVHLRDVQSCGCRVFLECPLSVKNMVTVGGNCERGLEYLVSGRALIKAVVRAVTL